MVTSLRQPAASGDATRFAILDAAVGTNDLPTDELVVDAERLARAASSAGCGLWELDVTTGATWVTEETRRLYGLTPDEPATWEGFVRLVHPEDRDEVVAKVKAVIATDGVFDERHRIVLPDGTVRWVHVTARSGRTEPVARRVGRRDGASRSRAPGQGARDPCPDGCGGRGPRVLGVDHVGAALPGRAAPGDPGHRA